RSGLDEEPAQRFVASTDATSRPSATVAAEELFGSTHSSVSPGHQRIQAGDACRVLRSAYSRGVEGNIPVPPDDLLSGTRPVSHVAELVQHASDAGADGRTRAGRE